MRAIKPTKQGKIYTIWSTAMTFNMFPFKETLNNRFEPGFRMVTINSCWACIESLVRECLDEKILRDYNKIQLPDRWIYKRSCWQKLRDIFVKKNKVKLEISNAKLALKTRFSEHIIDGRVTWEPLKDIAAEIGYPIDSISNESWAFVKHLYNLRNGFMHGSRIKILMSNSSYHRDEVSIKYNKALKYLDGEGVIDLQKLIKHQEINDFLNKTTTDFIINRTLQANDEISNIFSDTFQANQWRRSRNT